MNMVIGVFQVRGMYYSRTVLLCQHHSHLSWLKIAWGTLVYFRTFNIQSWQDKPNEKRNLSPPPYVPKHKINDCMMKFIRKMLSNKEHYRELKKIRLLLLMVLLHVVNRESYFYAKQPVYYLFTIHLVLFHNFFFSLKFYGDKLFMRIYEFNIWWRFIL